MTLNSKLRVLLADQPAKGTNIDSSYSNLGLLYLASTLRQDFGQDIQVDYLGPHQTLAEHIEWVKNYKPDIYAAGLLQNPANGL
jgi:hypothetical protein